MIVFNLTLEKQVALISIPLQVKSFFNMFILCEYTQYFEENYTREFESSFRGNVTLFY